MANRKRLIAAELLEDERLMAGGETVALLFIGLILNADDYGIVKANPGLVTSSVFRLGQHRVADVTSMLEWLEQNDFLIPFDYHGARYYALRTWWKWQTLSHPTILRMEIPQGVIEQMAVCAIDQERVRRAFGAEYQRGLIETRSPNRPGDRKVTPPVRIPAKKKNPSNDPAPTVPPTVTPKESDAGSPSRPEPLLV